MADALSVERRQGLEVRAAVLRSIRTFFNERGYLEIETPVRVLTPAVETHIDAEPSGSCFLRTSPELHMKRLLADGFERIYQIGPCFRRGERGRLHHPEYTMLEWYQSGGDADRVLAETRELMRFTVAEVERITGRERPEPLVMDKDWRSCSVAEAFEKWAGWNPVMEWDADRFDLDLVDKVEPAFPRDVPLVLHDYPPEAAALAKIRRKDGVPVAERWELYWGGVELANAYTELTDPVEQRRRFEEANRERAAAGRPTYSIDEAFMAALESGMPQCGGIALGVDRLAMLLAGADSLDGVIAFREPSA